MTQRIKVVSEPGTEPLQVQVFPVHPRAWVVRLQGAVDGSNVRLLEGALERIFDRGVYRMAIDLGEVTYMNSAAYGCLLVAMDRARREGGDVILARPTQAIRQVFWLLDVPEEVRFVEDFSSALAALVGPR